jgi:hypothetical protein
MGLGLRRPSMNLRRLRHGGFQLLDAEVLRPRDGQDHFLAPRQKFGGGGQLVGHFDRDYDRAVAVGVDEIARADDHAGDADGLAEALQMGVPSAIRD